jgi:hypothetical protein
VVVESALSLTHWRALSVRGLYLWALRGLCGSRLLHVSRATLVAAQGAQRVLTCSRARPTHALTHTALTRSHVTRTFTHTHAKGARGPGAKRAEKTHSGTVYMIIHP